VAQPRRPANFSAHPSFTPHASSDRRPSMPRPACTENSALQGLLDRRCTFRGFLFGWSHTETALTKANLHPQHCERSAALDFAVGDGRRAKQEAHKSCKATHAMLHRLWPDTPKHAHLSSDTVHVNIQHLSGAKKSSTYLRVTKCRTLDASAASIAPTPSQLYTAEEEPNGQAVCTATIACTPTLMCTRSPHTWGHCA